MSLLRGSIVAIVTPMKGGVAVQSTLDDGCFAKLIDYHVERGTRAIVAAGTTGESATLTFEEHCRVIERAVEFSDGRIPVIAGTGANSTHEALMLTKEAKKLGADAALIVTPYYNKPTQEGLWQHHALLAEEVKIPQILYNVPSRTACDLLPETVAKLSSLENIVGIKEATGDLSRVKELKLNCGSDFLLFSGDDLTARDFMLEGGDGVISVTANVAPKEMSEMCEAALAGKKTEAEEIDELLVGLHKDLFLEANPIPVKWAVGKQGLIEDGIRLPLTQFSEKFKSKLLASMEVAGSI